MALQIRGLFAHQPQVHNGSQVRLPSGVSRFIRNAVPWAVGGPLVEAETAPEQWSYALSYPLHQDAMRGLASDDALIVECKLLVHKGDLGIGVVDADQSSFVSREGTVHASAQPTTVRIWVREPAKAGHVLFRNIAADAKTTHFELLSIRALVMPGGRECHASWSSLANSSIPLDELRRVLAWAQATWDRPFPEHPTPSTSAALKIVDVGMLPSVLCRSETLVTSQDKSLADWKMETDDGPILDYLWRSIAPRRHLEFGTWEGFGATLAARAPEAEIWTLNLPGGETNADGETLYSSTDSGQFIGRLYREAGYEARVHQLLCDSREFDTRPFETSPFDTVLIDGGHTPDVVASDTAKALRVLKQGGACVWHDFCPDPDALSHNLAPLGVVQAVVENFEDWSVQFEQLFWVRKSWILVGLGRR